jgi:hypothetical protein
MTLPGDSAKLVVHGKGITTKEGFRFQHADAPKIARNRWADVGDLFQLR